MIHLKIIKLGWKRILLHDQMVSPKTTLGQQDAQSHYPTTFFAPVLPGTSPETIKQLDAGL
ncbi:MAG: hypothetical protein LPH21_15285 [Shewanella sp.]|nr:hypothetical protein [Shewanella sp.]